MFVTSMLNWRNLVEQKLPRVRLFVD